MNEKNSTIVTGVVVFGLATMLHAACMSKMENDNKTYDAVTTSSTSVNMQNVIDATVETATVSLNKDSVRERMAFVSVNDDDMTLDFITTR